MAPHVLPRQQSSASTQSTAASIQSTAPPTDSLQEIIADAIRRLKPVGRSDCARVNGGGPTSWLRLPIDLLLVIAMQCGQPGMPMMRLVCREWRDALDAVCMQLRPRMLHVPQLSARCVGRGCVEVVPLWSFTHIYTCAQHKCMQVHADACITCMCAPAPKNTHHNTGFPGYRCLI